MTGPEFEALQPWIEAGVWVPLEQEPPPITLMKGYTVKAGSLGYALTWRGEEHANRILERRRRESVERLGDDASREAVELP